MVSQRTLFLNHVAQTSSFPMMIEVEKASGVYLYGPDGTSYLDLISGIAVSNVGHCHPKVVKSIQDQASQYMHVMVYGEFIQTPQNLLAKALVDTLPSTLNNVYFVNSGSEAVEGALKLAKRFSGRPNIVSCKKSYHGSTIGALSVNGPEWNKKPFSPLTPGVDHITFNEVHDFYKINHNTAAVIIETIQGEAGIQIPDKGYLKSLKQHCQSVGALLILDEIQCGFGRTGTFWAFEQEDVLPDILVCAKGMGGGMPIGAFISSNAIMSVLKNDPVLGHITTFGGNAVCCAASLATLEVIFEEKLMESVSSKASYIISRLSGHAAVLSIRNKGLMMAVELGSFSKIQRVIAKALELGVITDWFLYCDDSIRICPPLTISEEELEVACNKILEALDVIE